MLPVSPKDFCLYLQISQATTCSYTVVGGGRKEKGGRRERRTTLEAPPKPVGRKWTLNIDKEIGKKKEGSAFPTRLRSFAKKERPLSPLPPHPRLPPWDAEHSLKPHPPSPAGSKSRTESCTPGGAVPAPPENPWQEHRPLSLPR